MEKEFSEQESLRLITDMINQARNDLQKGRGDFTVLWGYAMAIIALANFVLIKAFGQENFWIYLIWALTIPLFVVSNLMQRKKRRELLVKNRISNMISNLWSAYGITIAVIIASFYAVAIGFQAGKFFMLINPVIISITGLALFATGKMCRFKPFVYGGFFFWAGAVVCALVVSISHQQSFHFIVLALCAIGGFIIPGHLLNRNS